ncbi:MAG TPA: AmmeMemoRadiSam system protein B [Polyangiaceae bacterium]
MSSPSGIREPAVAGRFYPASPAALQRALEGLLAHSSPPASGRPALLAVVPHAGYVYSGRIAGATFARIDVPRHVVVLCPNHTGLGRPRALWSRGAWRTPLGEVEVAEDLAACLQRHAGLDDDELAHLREHAIEVELPFLQHREPQVRIAPLCLQRASLDECLELGAALAEGIRAFGERVLIVCSTDMSHYVRAELAAELDRLALDQIEALNPPALYRTVIERRISMCGFIPTTVGLSAARALGAAHVELVQYGNSGETSGDFERVVGYAGALIS